MPANGVSSENAYNNAYDLVPKTDIFIKHLFFPNLFFSLSFNGIIVSPENLKISLIVHIKIPLTITLPSI